MKRYSIQAAIVLAWVLFAVFWVRHAGAQHYVMFGSHAGAIQASPTSTPTSTPTPIPTYYIDDSQNGCGGSGCSNNNAGTSLGAAWFDLTKLSSVPLTTGQATCLAGQTTPNKTNGGIWRLTAPQSVVANGINWGLSTQATITSCDTTKPAIITGAKCYGKNTGYCVGESAVTWTQCTSGVAPCNSGAGITNVYYYARPNVVTGSVYVDDPDVITGTTLWGDQTKYLNSASCLPGAGCSRGTSKFQGEMTAGSWYDDGTNMFIWMSGNVDPGTHNIEAVVNSVPNALLQSLGNSGGTTNQYLYFSYLKLIYFADYGLYTGANSTTSPIHVWYANNLIGGIGQGPVDNEDGNHYAAGLYLKGANASISVPSDPALADELHVTNNTLNWCGSHNCIGSDSNKGTIIYDHNIVGPAEHNQVDIKCLGADSEVTNNYLHDQYDGTIAGTGGTAGNPRKAVYFENDWTACTGGQLLMQGNTIFNAQMGLDANEQNATGTVTGDTATAKVYNNTTTIHYTRTGITGIGSQFRVGDQRSLTSDLQNNIVFADVSGTEASRYSASGTPTLEAFTEQHNLFQNSSSNLGKVNYHSTTYTVLATWQALTGICTGTCGGSDIWGTDPGFVSLTPSSNLLPLCSSSPAVGAGSGSVGTSTTLGADPTTQACASLSARYIDNSSTGCNNAPIGCLDTNDGLTLLTAWKTLNKANITALSAGTTVYLVGQDNPSTTNGGIWREPLLPNTNTTGTAWGPSTQITFTAYDQTKLPIITAAKCYGAASGYCTGETPVTWTQCTSGAANCHSSTDPNIGKVYYYTRPTGVTGPIYVDDPDVINTSNIWADPSHFLQIANCLPGGGCSITSPTPNASRDPFQGPMTEGTSWDDGTRLYVWLVGGVDPTSHVIEAPTNTTGNGLIKSAVTAGHRDWIVYSYLKGMYSAAAGFTSNLNNTTDGIHVKFDHDQVGGTGQGPVTNGAGGTGANHYDQAIYIKGSLNANTSNHLLPIQLVPGSEAWETYNTLNNCGSHNCVGVDGQRGAIYVQNNTIGTAEHSQQDIKCAYNAIVSGNYMHDAWAGPWQAGASDANNNNSLYNEIDWDSCSGGTVLYENNTVNGANGAGASSQVNTAATGLVQNVDFYNNTITLNSNTVQRAGMNPFANPGNTINWDAQNNIIQSRLSNDYGYQQASAAGTYNLTEDYNLFFNPTGTNTNRLAGVNYTTLAGWQGTGHGTHDIWQSGGPLAGDPRLAPLSGLPFQLWDDSPAIGAGTGSVGNSTTMGATPTILGHELCPTAGTCPDNADDVQAAILAQPAGTHFYLDAGTYRITRTLVPKANDSLIGVYSDGTFPGGTITTVRTSTTDYPANILGSIAVTGWTTLGALWTKVVGASNAINSVSSGSCNDGTTACLYPQDFFLNGDLVNRTVTYPPTTGGVGGCHWYMDFTGAVGNHTTNTIYIACDPTTTSSELTVIPQAVNTTNNNITLENLRFTNFAANNNQGVLELDSTSGNAGLINGNMVRHNHGEGIKPRLGSQNLVASYNFVNENGQSGINSGGSVGFVVDHNTITRNNEDGVGYGFESGGTKFANSSGTVVTNNLIQNNNGHGLWGDVSEYAAVWDSNTITNNLIEGIRFEISGSPAGTSMITNNTLTNDGRFNSQICASNHVPIMGDPAAPQDCCTGEGTGTCGTACGTGAAKAFGEIDITDSQYVTVGGVGNGNTITSTCGGIRTYADDSRSVSNPTKGVVQSYNSVTLHTGSSVPSAPIGWRATSTYNIFTASPANSFDHNSYIWDNVAAPHVAAPNGAYTAQSSPYGSTNATTNGTWAAWRASGQDPNGTCVGTVGGAC